MKPMRQLVDAVLAKDGAQVQALWSQYPDLAKDPALWWPLHTAAQRGDIDILRFLLDHGADPNAHNVAGDTPLRRAVKNPHAFALVELLLAHGADLGARDKKGTSILRAARGKAMKEYLRRVGATDE